MRNSRRCAMARWPPPRPPAAPRTASGPPAASASPGRLAGVKADRRGGREGPRAPPAPAGGSAIRFEDVDFAYPGARRPALEGVALDIPAGATVAIVGPSGAGKTTLANLLLRFWDPAEGHILIDGGDPAESQIGQSPPPTSVQVQQSHPSPA